MSWRRLGSRKRKSGGSMRKMWMIATLADKDFLSQEGNIIADTVDEFFAQIVSVSR